MDETLQKIEEKFGPKFDELTKRADEATERLNQARGDDDAKSVEEATKALEDLQSQVDVLTGERDAKLRDAEREHTANELKSLREQLNERRELHSDFDFGEVSEETQEAIYGEKSGRSFYNDVRAALAQNDSAAMERWEEALDGKAMTEGTGSAGGLLVPDQISAQVLELRQQSAVLRSLFPSIQVDSDTLRIASVSSGLTAGWVAELAEKPVADLAFAEISTNIFTAAGLAVASNQLLRNAQTSVDTLVNRDLALRLANLEEIAFISGSGTGQPRGILNTSGINTVALTSTAIVDLLDAIVDAVTSIYTNYFGAPNAIVMHPRTWARIVKARESGTSANYIVGPGANPFGRRAHDQLPGYGSGQVPRGELFGLPVYTTANVPTNLGAGTNESRVIVGNFDEGLILENQGLTLDQSEHVYFTSNQTVFRAEEAVGFTAARYPKAFSVVQGAGLAAG